MPSYSRRVEVPGKTSQELYDKVAQDIDRFIAKAGIGQMDIERDAAKKEVRIKSKMVTATLACSEGCIRVDGQLSLFAAPFKSKIDDGINRWLGKTFGIDT